MLLVYLIHNLTPNFFKQILGKLYAVGGSDGTHSLSSTEIYDPESKTWTPGPNITTPRANVGVAVIGSRLYAVGGFSGNFILQQLKSQLCAQKFNFTFS